MGVNEYQCAVCKGIFQTTWSDKEVIAEMKSIFGQSVLKKECAIVCDDCFKKMNPADYPASVEEAVAEHLRVSLEKRA